MLLHPPRARDGFETLARGRLGDMDRAGRAGVEGVHRAQRVDGLLDVAHRHADQSLLKRTVLALLVLRSQVPRGRDDDLITLDFTVLDRLAVVKGATRGLPEAGAFASGGLRSAEVLGVAGLHGLDQLVDPLLHERGDVERLDLADGGTAERGLGHGQVALMAERLQERIDIGVSRSTDKGQTWEPMRIAMSFADVDGLPSGQNGVGDPAVLVDEKTGTIWVMAAWTHGMGNGRAWTNSMPGMEPMETPQLMLARSDDDGRTWSEPINITKQVKDPSWCFLLQGPGRGITMRDGTLVFAIQFIDKDRMPHAGIIFSKDHGETWHIHNPARSNTTEAQVAEVEPGVLMLNMRDNRGGARAVMTTRDLGRTWNEHVSHRTTLREPVCMASLIAVPAEKNVLGKDLLLFSNPDTTDGRRDITIKASLDGGVTWPYSLLLDEGDSWGYSCLTMIDSQTVGILYESSVAHIAFQAAKLNSIVK